MISSDLNESQNLVDILVEKNWISVVLLNTKLKACCPLHWGTAIKIIDKLQLLLGNYPGVVKAPVMESWLSVYIY